MGKRLFFGGLVVSGAGVKALDVVTEGEKILAVGEHLEAEGAEKVNLSGKYLFPGFIDSHTHMALEVSGTVTADDFDRGTRAELVGGTTCIVDFATQNRGESLGEALRHWHEKADGRSHCDYAFHLAMSDWNPSVAEELSRTAAEGIHSFKLYTTYDGMVVDDRTLYEILARVRELGGIAGIHCENKGIIDARLAEVLRKKGHRREICDYPWTRPALAEAEAVGRVLKIAACVDTPVVIVHLSCAEGFWEVRRARDRGQTVFVETCPQYLLLDESRYRLPGPMARRYMIAPPLRTKEDQNILWKALSEEEIQTVATDHCSFTALQKEMGREDFSKTPCGMPGAEERPALIWHFGVGTGRISAAQMCKYLSENPAKLYGLYPKKGVIAPGSDADLVVWDPGKEQILSVGSSAAGYSPMEGTKVRGRAAAVYLRGEQAAWDGKLVKEYGGRYQKAGTPVTDGLQPSSSPR